LQNQLVGVIPSVLYNYRTHGLQTTNPKNQEVARLTQKKIARNLFDYLSISYTNETIDFHLSYCMQNQIIESKNQFIKWDQHVRLFLNKQTPLIKDSIFIQFIFVNYWQDTFVKWHADLSFIQLVKLISSPFCMFSKITKLKYLAKKTIL
jgi:hypothetical protein